MKYIHTCTIVIFFHHDDLKNISLQIKTCTTFLFLKTKNIIVNVYMGNKIIFRFRKKNYIKRSNFRYKGMHCLRLNLERQKKRQRLCQLASIPSQVRMQIKVKVETESFLYTDTDCRGKREFCNFLN